MKSLLNIFFLSLIFLSPKISFAIGDTIPGDTTVKYDLWDPNNPNCPCHQYQKLADDEYARLHGQNNVQDTSGHYSVTANDTTYQIKNYTSTSTGSSKHYQKKLFNWKTMNKWMRKVKKVFGKKNNGTKQVKHRLANCFHF